MFEGIGNYLANFGETGAGQWLKNPQNVERMAMAGDTLANVVDPEGIQARNANPMSATKLAQSSIASRAEGGRQERADSLFAQLIKALSGSSGLMGIENKPDNKGNDLISLKFGIPGMYNLGNEISKFEPRS